MSAVEDINVFASQNGVFKLAGDQNLEVMRLSRY